MQYLLTGSRPRDLADGRFLDPGDKTSQGFDPKDPHNKQLIDDGHLVPLGEKKRTSTKKDGDS